MKNVLKQFGGKDIGSASSMFQRARILLTFLYLTVVVAILASSGSISHYIFSQQLEERFEETHEIVESDELDRKPPPPDQGGIKQDFETTVFWVNTILTIISGFFAYLLAGWTLRPIKRAYEKQQQFTANVSHELKTPLSILQTTIENRQRVSKSSAEQKQLTSYMEETKRMTRLVDDLLLLSQLDEQNVKQDLHDSMNLSEITNEVCTRISSFADKKVVQLECKIVKDVYVRGNQSQLMRAIENILKNAIFYSKKDGQVCVALEKKAKEAILTITDNGIGIPKDDLNRIFDRFYRAEKSRSRSYGGSGLGLSITKEILEQHYGVIQVKSDVSQGTQITIKLPTVARK